jgi:hypothetical protein
MWRHQPLSPTTLEFETFSLSTIIIQSLFSHFVHFEVLQTYCSLIAKSEVFCDFIWLISVGFVVLELFFVLFSTVLLFDANYWIVVFESFVTFFDVGFLCRFYCLTTNSESLVWVLNSCHRKNDCSWTKNATEHWICCRITTRTV